MIAPMRPGDDAIAMAGTFYVVAATDAALRLVTLTTVFYRFELRNGDVLQFYKDTQQYVGTVSTSGICPSASSSLALA